MIVIHRRIMVTLHLTLVISRAGSKILRQLKVVLNSYFVCNSYSSNAQSSGNYSRRKGHDWTMEHWRNLGTPYVPVSPGKSH